MWVRQGRGGHEAIQLAEPGRQRKLMALRQVERLWEVRVQNVQKAAPQPGEGYLFAEQDRLWIGREPRPLGGTAAQFHEVQDVTPRLQGGLLWGPYLVPWLRAVEPVAQRADSGLEVDGVAQGTEPEDPGTSVGDRQRRDALRQIQLARIERLEIDYPVLCIGQPLQALSLPEQGQPGALEVSQLWHRLQCTHNLGKE